MKTAVGLEQVSFQSLLSVVPTAEIIALEFHPSCMQCACSCSLVLLSNDLYVYKCYKPLLKSWGSNVLLLESTEVYQGVHV